MTDKRGDSERVEHLVEAKPPGEWVGPFQSVNNPTDGVEQAANGQQGDHGNGAAGEIGSVEDRGPAQSDVDRGVEPPWGIGPEDSEQDAQDRTSPHQGQQGDSVAAFEEQQREGCVGPGDKQEDVGVVEALEHCMDAR